MSDIYDTIMDLAKRRGFIWPTSECYGSVAGFIDYGPLGSMMKRNIENAWRRFYVIREGYYEIECPTIGQEDIFIASGHVKGFSDKMCQCPSCREFLRADHIAEAHGVSGASVLGTEDLARLICSLPCPACDEVLGPVDVFNFNLMFQTAIGPGSQRKGYLRPETAQGMFTDFQRLLRFYRDKLPFGAVQIGKSFRNEISPRQGMIRLREFTQAEAEIFVHPEEKVHPSFSRYEGYRVPLLSIAQQEKNQPPVTCTMGEAVGDGTVANQYVAYYLALTHELMVSIGVNPEKLRFRQHLPDERAHYAEDCWDAEIFSERFGWVETVGIADRTDYDLRAHERQSGERFSVFIPYETPRRESRIRVIPDMGALGPRFRGNARAVAEAICACVPGPEGLTVTIDGEDVLITPDLYTVKEEIVEVPGTEVVPHVIEPSYGIDRMIYAVLEHSYHEEMVEGEARRVLRLPPGVAPVQVAVFPLMNRDGLPEIALEIAAAVRGVGILAEYDDSGAIGRRYRRQDEVGTPFAITVDYDTRDDGTVTLRDRDSMCQVRVPIEGIAGLVRSLIDGHRSFAEL
ncbi:MAG: glycine--tRNA ligase [Methanomicrobiales archaeon]|nr:glycine--tRNA ligase [Methanomicrobiales archaeon]NYT20931.1 glycine--tRNA ligase [Methanomicrobiales archaeon]